jgi:Arc/MetJ family transcription regulator
MSSLGAIMMPMRTTVNVDSELLETARQALGTEGVSDTVNAALEDIARRTAIKRFDVRLFDVTDEDIALSRRDRLGDQES